KRKKKRAGATGKARDTKNPTRGQSSQSATPPPAVDYAADPVLPDRVPIGLFVGGVLCLVAAVAATFVLVLSHVEGISMPGCGQGGGCAEAAASAWGKVPGIGKNGWPVSFLGFAYFSGLLVAWLSASGGVPALLRYLVRFGVLISLMFIVVLIVQRHLCIYCLASHAANIAFWIILERVRVRPASPIRLPVIVTVIFLLLSAGLYGVDSEKTRAFHAEQEKERQESVKQMIASNKEKARAAQAAANRESKPEPERTTPPAPVAQAAPPSSTQPPPPMANPDSTSVGAHPNQPNPAPVAGPATPQDDRPWTGGFTGRYRLGPEKAAIRIVMISDYQCIDCQRLEPQFMKYVEEHDNISFSMKHFPMCADCNPNFRTRNIHPNACWAAYAAEAAGIMGGNETFWKMHSWLFERKGSFTSEELQQAVFEFGLQWDEFVKILDSDLVRKPVAANVKEAIWLGLYFTPMVFINGVEFKGVFVPNAVQRTMKQLLAENPEPLTAEWDQPPPAVDKCVSDWQAQYVRHHAPDRQRWPKGPDDAPVKIVMWGDFQEKYTAIADQAVRDWMAGKEGDVIYTFRHFPFNQECNPVVSVDRHPMACLASRAAEAAGILAGIDGYWKMHAWLMANQEGLNEAALRAAAVEMGFDPTALFSAMNDPQIAFAIEEDCRAAKSTPKTSMRASFLWRAGIPTIYINEKVVPRWRLQDRIVIHRILDAAYAE
ncbi:MAG: DsbA family protein, partial [Phycisphaerae bacterium]